MGRENFFGQSTVFNSAEMPRLLISERVMM